MYRDSFVTSHASLPVRTGLAMTRKVNDEGNSTNAIQIAD
jgi:hypothetical protein